MTPSAAGAMVKPPANAPFEARQQRDKELPRVADDPTVDGRVVDLDAALRENLLDLPI